MQAFDGGISKLFEVISRICKQDIDIVIDGKHLHYDKPKRIKISPSFFYADGCDCCSRCCGNYGHILTQSEYYKVTKNAEKYSELLNFLERQQIEVNGKKILIYKDVPRLSGLTIHTAKSERPACYWSYKEGDKYLCKIHDVRTFTCRMPHMMFRYCANTQTTNIGIYDFGRNWALGCPYILRIGNLDTLQQNIFKLKYSKQIATDLGLETYVDECLRVLKAYTNNFSKFEVPTKALNVFLGHSPNILERRFNNGKISSSCI